MNPDSEVALEQHDREWHGIFIPAAVWLNPNLSCSHKCLYAEIHSNGGWRGNCFASNKFLGEKVGVGENRASVMIGEMVELGFVEIVRFDGRKRYLKTVLDRDSTKAAFVKTQRQTIEKDKGSLVENTKIIGTVNSTDELEEKKVVESAESSPPSQTSLAQEVFSEWNNQTVFPKCLTLSGTRRRTLESRLKEPFFKANWKDAMLRVRKSSFCCGENDRKWRADFDWFVRPDTVAKIMEGKYDNKDFSNQTRRLPDGRVMIGNVVRPF
jgi:hypothetical protein